MCTSGRGVGQRNPKVEGMLPGNTHRKSQWSRQRRFQMGDAEPLCALFGVAQHLVFVCTALWPVQYRIPWITYGRTGHGK